MEKLTKRQAETLEWIKKFVMENGKPPSYREIGDAFGIASSKRLSRDVLTLSRKPAALSSDNPGKSLIVFKPK